MNFKSEYIYVRKVRKRAQAATPRDRGRTGGPTAHVSTQSMGAAGTTEGARSARTWNIGGHTQPRASPPPAHAARRTPYSYLSLGSLCLLRHGGGLHLALARRRRRRVRHRRVVEVDAHLAVAAPLVAEGVLDAHLVARGRVGEDVVAHRLRSRAIVVDLVVAERDVLPAAAAVDRKAGVLALEGVILHRLGADKVRHRLLRRRAERA